MTVICELTKIQRLKNQYVTLFLTVPILVATLFSVGVTFEAASAQEMQPIIDRMNRLERDIRALNIQLSGAAGARVPKVSGSVSGLQTPTPANPATARLGVRLTDLENDLRAMTGTIENFGFKVNQIGERLDKLVSDIDFRLSALEAGRAGTGNPLSSAPAPGGVQTVDPTKIPPVNNEPGTLGTVSAKAVAAVNSNAQQKTMNDGQPINPPTAKEKLGVLPEGTPRQQYNYASGLLRQTRYAEAEVALKEFIERNRDNPLASNARYWLGETYYVRDAYDQAAKTFYEGYEAAPTGAKALDMLLKLGMSLAGMGKVKDACVTFSKVLTDFPGATGTVRNKIAREQKRNACG